MKPREEHGGRTSFANLSEICQKWDLWTDTYMPHIPKALQNLYRLFIWKMSNVLIVI